MMRTISLILLIIFSQITLADTNTDPDCINHLGGAFGGVECYNGLSKELELKNKSIAKKILQKVPKNNSNRGLLKKYTQSVRNIEVFCNIQKNAYANWKTEKPTKNPRYFDYDVVYFECVYNRRQEENKFLTKIEEYLEN